MTSAPVAGVMERVTLDAGDRVVAGETVLTRIEAPRAGFYDLREAAEAKARVTSTEAQRDLAAADVERAEAELKRDKELAPRGAVTDRDLESAELDVPVKQAAVEVAKHTLAAKTAEVAVAKAALIAPEGDEPPSGLASQGTADAQPRALEPGIKAPPAMRVLALVTGFLLRKIKESETMVAAGDPLFELGTIAQLEVLVEMLSEDAVKVRAGAPAVMEGWGCAHALKGVVRRVEPFGFTKISALGIEEQRVNVIVDFTDPRTAWERLGHGYGVDVASRPGKGRVFSSCRSARCSVSAIGGPFTPSMRRGSSIAGRYKSPTRTIATRRCYPACPLVTSSLCIPAIGSRKGC